MRPLKLAVRAVLTGAALFVLGTATPATAFGPVPPSPIEIAPTITKVQFFWPFNAPPSRERRPATRYNWQSPPPAVRQAPTQAPSQAAPVARGPAAGTFGDVPAVEGATRVVVFGDSMAVGLADALTEALPADDGFQVQRMTKTSSGIVREDFFDWPGEVRDRIAGERIDVAVWMIGINDRQEIHAEGESFQPKTPRWTEIYQQRIDELIAIMQENGTAVYWVGMPIMRAQRYSEDIAFINNTVRERVGLQGAEYIDVWDAFADQAGAYTSHGPDLNGERRRMRRDNGIHLTDAGNAKLAHFVEQAILRDVSVAGLGADGRRIIRQNRSGGLIVDPGSGALVGANDELAGSEAATAARGANGVGGPSVALSTLGSGARTDGEDVVSPLFTVLMRGEALEPKPGRADDFSWPREE